MIGVISDVHGNFPALRQVIEALRGQGCAEIYCLGDIAGYYAMINECIQLIRAEGIVCLKGNHDAYLLGEFSCPRSRSANDCIRHQRRIITPQNLKWLSTLPSELATPRFHAVHGGWNDPLDEYIDRFDFENAPAPARATGVFLSGHTHMQTLQARDGVVYANPGSVGQPRDHDWRAAYATLDGGTVRLHRAEYDVDEIAEAMRLAGFGSYYYRNLYLGRRIGET